MDQERGWRTDAAREGGAHAETGPHGYPQIPSPEVLVKLPRDGGDHWNRLVFEKSPYLLQHAANPVDWFPWGDEAFSRARAEDKPIFLSIGYSTCHWCHVMERESFSDPEIAKVLNAHFIAIKVDREERPDIDEIYMTAVRALTRGGGGWPLSAFLTPDGKPFFGGTYFPPDDRHGRPGFRTLLLRIDEAWRTDRASLLKTTEQVTAILERSVQSSGGGALSAEVLERAAASLAASHDAAHGGFGKSPKFPSPHNLTFLLRDWARSGDAHSLEMVKSTLDAMARGGIADQLGGGFHRYSTDERWLVPHFEKMLYDQATLSRAYLEAYQATRERRYAESARAIFRYVLRDMTSPEGGFYSAEDADSEGEEGRFYVWTPAQVGNALDDDTAALFMEAYGVTASGNFDGGVSILHLNVPLEEVARRHGLNPESFARRMEEARAKLLDERSQRVRPFRDDKILACWNGLMISSLAYGSQVLKEPSYRQAAEKAARFVLDRLRGQDGRLLRRYRDGHAGLPGTLDDYAFMTSALIDLYEATFAPEHLSAAIELARAMKGLFWDERDGGFTLQGKDQEAILVRPKDVYDGAIPSGNSAAALALLRLGALTADAEFDDVGRKTIEAFSSDIDRSPAGYTAMLSALDFSVGPSVEIVLAGQPESEGVRRMVEAIRSRYIPRMVMAVRPDGREGERLAKLAPFLEGQRAIDGKPTAYVCRNHACSLPTHDTAEMLKLISSGGAPRD
jgi:uncharacterized protein YyaL (SSP411 family)